MSLGSSIGDLGALPDWGQVRVHCSPDSFLAFTMSPFAKSGTDFLFQHLKIWPLP
ncbi:hypothetical protein BDN72DRAFT_844226 [Pluteus cervinus]|uniref:Uncharacterized protein n=1 Tax=Pluteus cervinus TaxID=181527 RepID=A0ACD3AMS6_9AGAR|nr:hypothetical protein BDN72DRAFT_844226 [Pluteus cervinus]